MNSVETRGASFRSDGGVGTRKARPSRTVSHRKQARRRQQGAAGYAFITPFIIVFILFAAFPDVYTFIISFQNNSGFGPTSGAGWSNYIALLTYGAFWSEVFNTLEYWVLHAVILIPVAFGLALVVRSRAVRGKSLWRILLFLPQVMSIVAVGLVFQVIFASPSGLVNNLTGLDVAWLQNPAIAKYVVVAVLVWQGFGFWFVVFLSGLTTLDPAVDEAATMDGASTLQRTLRITVPLMKDIIFFAVIIDAIASMALFTQPNVLTTNNNQLATPAVATISNLVVGDLQSGVLGKSAAAGVLTFMLTLLVSAVLFLGYRALGGRTNPDR